MYIQCMYNFCHIREDKYKKQTAKHLYYQCFAVYFYCWVPARTRTVDIQNHNLTL